MLKTVYCATCKRPFAEGEKAWASDWKVLDLNGDLRNETRYTCDDCEDIQCAIADSYKRAPIDGMCACGSVCEANE